MRRTLWHLGAAVVILMFAVLPGRSQPGANQPPAQTVSTPWLHEVVRYLYRWDIDESDIDAVIAANEVTFWVRESRPQLDEGDRSRFVEVVMPQFARVIKAKQADYSIPELNAVVKNADFRITSVEKIEKDQPQPAGSVEVRMEYKQLRDELFRTRHMAGFPEGELLERLRAAVRAEVGKDPGGVGQQVPPPGGQVVYLAPLSPVANETWVYWETGKMLIRFASDIDLTNPAVWDHEKLAVRLFHLEQKVVVSLDEVAGSNAFMTRDQAGRALYNCVVLGKRMELQPPAPAAAAPPGTR